MGSGTEVSRQTSDLILTDDNFATIISAVEEGRNIYLNIQKAVLYLPVSYTHLAYSPHDQLVP